MLDYAQLAALRAVITTGSFEAAAAELAVTPSAISQRIKLLEDQMGAVLVQRGKPCLATPAGTTLVGHTDRVALLERQTLRALGQTSQTDAIVPLAVTADSLASFVLEALEGLPFCFDLVEDDQDHSADWLRRGEVVAAITAHPGPIQGCDSHALGQMRYVATASPDFADAHFSDGVTPETLAHAPVITFGNKDALQSQWAQREIGRRITLRGHKIPSVHPFTEATRRGLGWGMNPLCLIAEDVKAGRLVPIGQMPDWDVALHWQVSRVSATALIEVTDAIRHAAADVLSAHAPDKLSI